MAKKESPTKKDTDLADDALNGFPDDPEDWEEEEFEEEDDQDNEPGMAKVEKKVTYERPIHSEKRLPTGDDYSKPEEDAIIDTKNMDLAELLEGIGVGHLDGWSVRVKRHKPDSHLGMKVRKLQLHEQSDPITLKDLKAYIFDNHGGGAYSLHFHDNRSINRRTDYIRDNAIAPKLTDEECPELALRKSENPESDELDYALKKARIEEEIREIKEGAKKGDDSAARLFELMMQMQMVERQEQSRLDEIRRRELADERREAQRKHDEMMQMMMDKNNNGNDTNMFAVMMQNQAKQSEIQMQMQMQQSQLMMTMMKESADRNMTMLTAMMNKPESNNFMDFFKVVQDSQHFKMEMFADMFQTVLAVTNKDEEDAHPIVGAIKAIAPMIDKGLNTIGSLNAFKKLQPGPTQQQLPGPAPSPAQPVQPAPGPMPQQQAAPQQNVPTTQSLEDDFSKMNDVQKLTTIISVMIGEAATMPKPEDSVLCMLLTSQYAPEMLDPWMRRIDSGETLQKEVMALVINEQDRQVVQDGVFSSQARIDWVMSCIDFVMPEETVPETPPAGTTPEPQSDEDQQIQETDESVGTDEFDQTDEESEVVE